LLEKNRDRRDLLPVPLHVPFEFMNEFSEKRR
jgi:hypothetical protein